MPGSEDMGTNSLCESVESGETEAVRQLLSQGAEVNPQDMSWRTPLDLAEESRYRHVADMLLERGAKKGKKTT